MPLADHKRLLIFCDGTNQDGLVATDNGTSFDDDEPLYYTNVLRLSRAVLPRAPDAHDGQDVLQVVYYQSGVGTESDFRGHASSYELALELFGTAVARKIRDAYAFITQNWTPGDEIFLFGFPRGAYTARKVAGLIDRMGLLDVKEMGMFYPYWYALETGKGVLPQRPKTPVPIQIVGVWDTVGAIRTSLLQPFPGEVHRLGIHDALLPRNVKLALHAVALHENRNWFQCTLWEDPSEDEFGDAGLEELAVGQELKQVWFGGEHSDVGGGWDQHELADISLFWMAGECQKYIAFDEEMLLQTIRHPSPQAGEPRKPSWGTSVPHNSYMHTPPALALLGHITAKTRLADGTIQRNSLFHPSLQYSSRPSHAEKIRHDEEQREKLEGPHHLPRVDTAFDPRARAELKGGEALLHAAGDVLKAMGKYMITFDDLEAKYGKHWKPRYVQLNPLEIKARERWERGSDIPEHKATYESAEQVEKLLHDTPQHAAQVHTS
ncbi:hypothetical protein EXIGLDRAFT_730338 [Exidia glandulosa HHB12029]|uniref:T6SS Phospholipase effector Tle1-like catalytic domain-containing protein n=1 Tax=Exidia glandulosa HHB12029 TaxID=1314781 RepID=A0A165C7R1_EXIGL|nr:hypothetical protein EXIGLDRAFT_730338 [Exidia glandulosa HHB12029]